jgi:hypothetical protein
VLRAIFGARGQVVVGFGFVIATAFQAWWWGIHSKPSTAAIFWLSIEALFFAGYNVIPTALGWRTAERVETAVVEEIEHADQVDVG